MSDTHINYCDPWLLDYIGNGLRWEDIMAESTYVNKRFMRTWPLTVQEKKIVDSIYVKGLSQAKTAAKLKISQPAVSQKLVIIKNKLKDM